MAKEDEEKKAHEDEERDEELDEEEDDDEEDDADDEEDDVAEARPPHSHAPPPPPPPAATDEDPTWWVPHAVMGTLVVIGVLGFFGAFNTWLKPLFGAPTALGSASAAAAQPATPPPTPPTPPKPLQPAAEQAPVELFGAKHLIVQYKGSTRAPASVTRTKEEAKARTEEALKKLKGGAKWEDIVGEYSDEPGAAKRAGNLGNFRKGSMDKRFQAAVEALKIDQMSDVVESDFGFHIIVRTR